MSTHPTALDLDLLGALMVTPLIVLALAVLAFMFLTKLLIELVAAGFER